MYRVYLIYCYLCAVNSKSIVGYLAFVALLCLTVLALVACDGGRSSRMSALLDRADSLNRNYVPMTDGIDSLLLDASEYYDHHGTPNQRMRAHYLLGCAYRDLGDAPQALHCYQDAVDAADTLDSDCDYRLLSCVYGQSGNLFRSECLYRDAINDYLSATHYAWLAKDTLSAILAYGQTAACYYGLGNEDSTLIINRLTRNQLLEYGDTSIANTFLAAPIYILLSRQQYVEAKTYLDLYQYHSSLADSDVFHDTRYYLLYYYKGLYYQGIGRCDSALYYFHQLVNFGKTKSNIRLGYKGLHSLYSDGEKPDSLIKYASLYTSSVDSAFYELEQSKLQNIHGLYNYTRHQHEAEEQRQKADRLRFWLSVSILIFAIVVLLSLWIVSVIRAKDRQQLYRLSSKYALGMIEFHRLKSEKDSLEQQHDRFREKYEAVAHEYEQAKNLLAEMQSDNKSPEEWDLGDVLLQLPIVMKFHKIASTASVVSDDEWKELRSVAKQYMPNFMHTINHLDYKIDRRETDICILLRLRFIPTEICNIVNVKKNNLGNIRKRLLKSMFGIDGSSKQFDSYIQQIPR